MQQQRFELLRQLARDPNRHLILVTATPHSGIEESFRSLLGLLDPAFDKPTETDIERRKLVPHLVQRRRADLVRWLGADTAFPERDPHEVSYGMSDAYTRLYERVLAYCRDTVAAPGTGGKRQQRVRYWAAIAILRCVLSSPAAARSVLTNQAKNAADREAATDGDDFDPDAAFAAQVLDLSTDDQPADYAPTAPLDARDDRSAADDTRLGTLLREAGKLDGAGNDHKLRAALDEVATCLQSGYRPIVYCRFIATANYVVEHMQKGLERRFPSLHVQAVSGEIGDEQRRERVEAMAAHPVRVLVATDCLSEGINLQHQFDAVVHYDLPWNPNRLEQREGRVDRFGQEKGVVRTTLLYGVNNEVDATVLDVLIRKARTIRQQLGISVPGPVGSEQVVQAVVENVLLRSPARPKQLQLALSDSRVSSLHREWDEAAEREGKARAFFAQQGISPEEVARELRELEPALGHAAAVQGFLATALQRFNGELRATRRDGIFELHPGDLAPEFALRVSDWKDPLRVSFDDKPRDGVAGLTRNHPAVAVVTESVLGAALSPVADPRFSRAGATWTNAVSERTALLVLRLRYLLRESGAEQFAEEVVLASFERGLHWREPLQEQALALLGEARPAANIPAPEREAHVRWALDGLAGDWWKAIIDARVDALRASHARLRSTVRAHPLDVTPHTPPDVLGCYVFVPAGGKP